MDAFLTSEGLLALVTLTFLEVILGVDNVIFIIGGGLFLLGKATVEIHDRLEGEQEHGSCTSRRATSTSRWASRSSSR